MNKRSRKSDNRSSITSRIRVLQRKKYSCCCKIFCCKCIHCCQSLDFSLLTSENRKTVFHSMIKQYVKSIEEQPNIIIDPFFVLVGLLMGDNDSIISDATRYQILNNNRENRPLFSKQDLELYIPQLCTYLVFHEQMKKIPIFDLLERTSRADLNFAMKYYLYMKSLQSINQNSKFSAVIKFNENFLMTVGSHFIEKQRTRKNIDLLKQQKKQIVDEQELIAQKSIQLENYSTIFQQQQRTTQKQQIGQQKSIFKSSLEFLDDLTKIGENLLTETNKKQFLQSCLEKINKNLPAKVLLPLKSIKGRLMISKIVLSQSKIFQTKTRAPYYLCVEAFQPDIQLVGQNFQQIVSTTSLQTQMHRSSLFEQDSIENIHNIMSQSQYDEIMDKGKNLQKKWFSKIYDNIADKAKNIYSNNQFPNQEQEQRNSQQMQQLKKLFGESQQQSFFKIRQQSEFKNSYNYSLLHLMVKTQDDLRQESFAMQLLCQFNTIFQIQGLPIKVIPYQVVSLGYNCGIIEFLKDTLTLDQIRKRQSNLDFIRNNKQRRKRFLQTLVGYSLITYFLQVKDRHNGNILIKRDGSIIHIDFGFLISNSPGKGVQLQKKVPFKLTAEYIDTIGGIYSKDFGKFRKLFFKGYQACRKHQHRILILTKLMYSSHGTTMPCFQKGNQAIEAMQERFNPAGIRTDGDLSLFCQNLINTSIDNWRVKWYDKWQYYFQGILY